MFCNSLIKIYENEKLGIRTRLRIRHKERNNNTRQLTVRGRKQVIKLGEYLYKDSTNTSTNSYSRRSK